MNRETILASGTIVFGVAYLGMVFLAGMRHGHLAMILAVLACGVTYLSYCGQLAFPNARRSLHTNGVCLTILLGALAGLALLAGV